MVKEFTHWTNLDHFPTIAPCTAIIYSIREKSMTVRMHRGRPRFQLLQWKRYTNK